MYPEDATRCSSDGCELEPYVDPMLGKTLVGRYNLLSILGSGGMSSVYLARHEIIGRQMAIKVLRRDLAQDATQKERFLREARAVNQINHPNIVEITDYGETDDGLLFLVMEYVKGESLLGAMKGGRLSPDRALRIALQIAQALSRAHAMGIIHRDLKPENILLVSREGKPDFVKVLDFGIAKVLDAPSLTRDQQVFGTPGYIAPEYFKSPALDGRADLYSLGVVIYELLTKDLPFKFQYPGDLLIKAVTEDPIPLSERRPGIPQEVEAVVMRCLSRDREKRFSSADELMEAIDAALEQISVADDFATEDAFDGNYIGPASVAPTPVDEKLPSLIAQAEANAPATVGELSPVEDDETDETSTDGHPGASRPQAPVRAASSPPGARELTFEDTAVDSMEHRKLLLIPPAPEGDFKASRGARSAEDPFGVQRWRRRMDAIVASLELAHQQEVLPHSVAEGLGVASTALEELKELAEGNRKKRANPRQLATVSSTLRESLDVVEAFLRQRSK